MRRNGVIDITSAGSSVSSVIRMTICIGTLNDWPFGEMLAPKRGPVAAAVAAAAGLRRNSVAINSLIAGPPEDDL